MAISFSGLQLAAEGADGTLRIRHLRDGTVLVTLRSHGASVGQVAFRPGSTTCSPCSETAQYARRTRLVDDVRTVTDSRVTRALTAEERAPYLGEPS